MTRTPPRPAGADVGPEASAVPWRTVLLGLWLISVALVVLSYALPALTTHPLANDEGELRRYVDVSREANLPTWWSGTLLGTGGTLFLATAWLARASRSGGSAAWATLGGLLLLMALDDATELHERLDRWGVRFVDVSTFTFVWLVIGIPVAVAVLVLALVSARGLPRTSRRLTAAGLVLFFAAAIGLELVGGELIRSVGAGRAYSVSYHLEELGEMLGAATVAVAPLAALRVRRRDEAALVLVRG